jgi:hypothetical protein
VTAPFQDEANWSGAPDENVAGPYDEMSSVLAELPRPRPVRMSRRGKSTAVLVTVILLVSMTMFFAGLAAQARVTGPNAGSPLLLKFALPIVFILVIVPLMLVTIARQKILLAEGEIATAHVTKRRLARHGPTIRYEFTTRLGEHFSRGASDGSGQLSVGMNVPIFYDAQNPKKQLALCASFYEVVLPRDQ